MDLSFESGLKDIDAFFNTILFLKIYFFKVS